MYAFALTYAAMYLFKSFFVGIYYWGYQITNPPSTSKSRVPPELTTTVLTKPVNIYYKIYNTMFCVVIYSGWILKIKILKRNFFVMFQLTDFDVSFTANLLNFLSDSNWQVLAPSISLTRPIDPSLSVRLSVCQTDLCSNKLYSELLTSTSLFPRDDLISFIA